ncbi:MAG: hypothetical protein QXV51_01985 [Thermosphaera sp.]
MPIIGAYVIFTTNVSMDPATLLGFMYDLQTFFKHVKNVKINVTKEGVVVLSTKVKTFHGFDRELNLSLKVESITRNSIVIKGVGELADFVMKADLKPADKGSIVDVNLNCESKEGGICNNFISLLYSGLVELFEKPPKVSVKPPPVMPAPAPTPVPAVPAAKPELPAPPPKPQPIKPEEEYPLEKLLDETYLAILMLKSDLITTKNLSPGWSISEIVKISTDSLKDIAKFKLGLITIRDVANRISLTIPVSRTGDLLGFVGMIDNKAVKGPLPDLERTIPLVSRMPVSVRVWGVKELA